MFVALGMLAAIFLTRYLAKRYFLSADLVTDLVLWSMLGAMLGARIFHVVFYQAQYYIQNPQEIIAVWHGGLSSLGGMVGGALAAWLFVRLRKLSKNEILAYVDVTSLGLWLGWGIGRLGCFFIHDHPGTLSSFVLAVNYPGGSRLDMGLLESITGFLIFGVFAVLFPRLIKKYWGLAAALSWLSYAVIRFGLDFLRATDMVGSDARYLGLTPAQWGMAVIICTLTTWLIYGTFSRQKVLKLRS